MTPLELTFAVQSLDNGGYILLVFMERDEEPVGLINAVMYGNRQKQVQPLKYYCADSRILAQRIQDILDELAVKRV